ncbi:MAG: hypothetical protein ACE5ER_04530 [Nitrospinaceae bacterium]
MKQKSFSAASLFLVILLNVAPAWAASGGELLVWKKDPFFYGACGFCAEFFNVRPNEDLTDFSGFEYNNQTGYYYVTLSGPSGATVTLFGGENYQKTQGFLIVTKLDGDTVQIEDLEDFKPGRWVEVPAEAGYTGAYRAWYQPYEKFKDRVASLKWGHWWTGPVPQ